MSAADHITNSTQFVRQRDSVQFPNQGVDVSPSTGNQSWNYGNSRDTYHHIVGSQKQEHYDYETDDTKTVSVPMSNATLQVTHRGAEGSTEYRPDEEWKQRNFDYRMDSLNKLDGEVPGQLSMFHHRSSHPSSEVSYMMSTRGGRVANMTQLGMAARDTLLTKGRQVKPSDDLSMHSTNLVERLEERGLTTNRKVVTNRLDFEDKPYPVAPDYGYGAGGSNATLAKGQFEPVPDADVSAGRGFMRSLVGATRKKTPNEEQMRLF